MPSFEKANRGASLEARVWAAVHERKLIAKKERIVAGVSGGLDSMCLLHLLCRIAPKIPCVIHVAHLDHRLRGRDSAADARFVARAAARLSLKCTIGSADVQGHAAAEKISIEMAARELRRTFLTRVAEEQRANSIFLAHHADDQVELFFLRLLRGSGSEGLRGMLWKAPSEHKACIHYARPLLDVSRAELEAYARSEGIKFREDASNRELNYARNRVRHELLPALAKISGRDCRGPILRAMETLGAEASFLSALADDWLKAPTPFDQLHIALQRRVIHQQLIDLSIAPEFDLTERLRLRPDEKISISPLLAVARKVDGALELIEEAKLKPSAGSVTVDLTEPAGELQFGGAYFSWLIIGAATYRPRAENTEVFDADKIGPALHLRHWRAGDRYQPIGLPKSAKLQDLFTNAKIPAAARRKLILAETSVGGIFWAEGLRIAEAAKVSPETKRLLVWQWKRQS